MSHSVDQALTFALSRPDWGVKNMFHRWGFKMVPLKEANFVVFPGGADINPFLYGEKRLENTHINHRDDVADIKALKTTRQSQYKIGICRGGQFLNVMCGGKLYQHVTDHALHGVHPIWKIGCNQTDPIQVTSTHHQMMIPCDRGKVLFAANRAYQRHTEDAVEEFDHEERKYLFDDAEVVVYPDDNTLCFQPHPEYEVAGNDGCTALFFDLIAENCLCEDESEEMYARYTAALSTRAERATKKVTMYGREG